MSSYENKWFLCDFADADTTNVDPRLLDPLSLAFLGDAVFDLIVRRDLVVRHKESVGKLNKRKIQIVCCSCQCEAIRAVQHLLTSEELSVYKRGKNARIKRFPKNSTLSEYRSATGFECLLGYLYLIGNFERITLLVGKIYEVLGLS